MTRSKLSSLLLGLCIFVAACGGSSDEPADVEARDQSPAESPRETTDAGKEAGSYEDAMREMERAFSGAADGETIEPVDFRQLRDLLPADLPGMVRTDAGGERTAVMGIRTSNAHAEYEADEEAYSSISLKITDLGSVRSLAMFGYAWMMAEVDRETDTGFERTGRYQGHPSFEEYREDGSYRSGKMQVVVGNRFIVESDGNGVSMDQIRGAINRIDLAQLTRLGG